MPLNEHWLSFIVDHQRCHGMLHLPLEPQEKPIPCVLMLHGFTGQALEPHRFFAHIARAFAANGIAAFRFDYRGSGNSEGDFSEMTAGREVQDARAALRLLESRSDLDRARFGLLGLSMGGMVAALTAGIESFKALSLLAPTKPQHMLGVVRQAKTESEIDALFDSEFAGSQFPPTIRFNSSRKMLDFGGNPVSSEFFKGLLELDSVKSAATHQGASIVIHGSDDLTVPVAIGQEYANALNTKLLEIAGGNHTFDDLEHQNQVIAGVLEFYGLNL
jgi:pimeloyl-ACP methyl ester carboxylesterase